jgi:hypothetical protein
MAFYAELDRDGLVTNIVVADSKEIAEALTRAICVEYSEEDVVNIGITKYTDSAFVNPEPEISDEEPPTE